ncbi:hypothetical protein B0I35DRAFT_483592 [Stachybotrys elegans]|uniref:Uncharacterized protein n=1 Tax=Stachybotrys elegans TaxID=80388 RepID=A0A8K0SKQ4_9HYPO|nr:hypothetical protein B0I35DRAFT_483592 [Stachybotrys elegans]
MSQLSCAGVVAHLEGSQGIPLPSEADATVTLERLHQRTQVLEGHMSCTSPDALLEPNWHSLAWRLCRLSQKFRPYQGKVLEAGRFASLVSDLEMPPVEKIYAILCSIKQMSGQLFTWDPLNHGEDDKSLGIMVQRLCYMTGSRMIQISTVPTNFAETYLLAVDLSIKNKGLL